MPSATQPALRIAVIGTGPGGLSSAIALSGLPNVHLRVFERAGELNNLGAGISVNHNGWKVLELLGARAKVTGASTVPTVMRNAYTGEIVDRGNEHDPNDQYESRRVRRLRLQQALAARVPEGLIEFNKKLVSLEDLKGDGVRLTFSDGTDATTDLVVGADGIRSVVRQHIYPEYRLEYVGQVGWRVLLPVESIKHIPDLPFDTTSWWYGAAQLLWLSPVDEPSNSTHVEFTCRSYNEPYIEDHTRSWGIPASNERVLEKFKNVDPRLVALFHQVPDNAWREFATYIGPLVDSLIAWNKIALVGDSSHPSVGGFGAGSAFAMEDSWTLARAIEHARTTTGSNPETVTEALRMFNEVRRPFYQQMADFRLAQKESMEKLSQKHYDDFDGELRERFRTDGLGSRRGKGFLGFVYGNDVGKAWEEYVESEKAKRDASEL